MGAQLLYDPSPGFSTRRYLRANPDVAAAGMNPLVHYLRFGRGEGRPCFPVGNYTEDDNTPLIVARNTRENDRDMQANRRNRLFAPDYYLGAYTTTRASGMAPLLHFVEHGSLEARYPNSHFHSRSSHGQ